MISCPNINLPEWKKLKEAFPDLAYYLWDKHGGEIPESLYNQDNNNQEGFKKFVEQPIQKEIKEETKYPYKIYKGDVKELSFTGEGVSFFTRDKVGADYYTQSREEQGLSKGNKTFEGYIITKNPLIVDHTKPGAANLNGIATLGEKGWEQKVKDAGYDAVIINRKFPNDTPIEGWEIISFNRNQIKSTLETQEQPIQKEIKEDKINRQKGENLAQSKFYYDTTISEETRNFIQTLIKNFPKIASQIKIIDNKAAWNQYVGEDAEYMGYFATDEKGIGYILLNKNRWAKTDTLAHEMLHAFTQVILDNPETQLEKDYVKNLTVLFNQFKELKETKTDYEYQANDINEFLAYSLTNKEFQNFLKFKFPKEQKSLFQQLIDLIKSLFGNKVEKSYLEKITNLTEDIINKTDYKNYKSRIQLINSQFLEGKGELTQEQPIVEESKNQFEIPHSISNLLNFLSAKFGVKWDTVHKPNDRRLGFIEGGKVYINTAYEITAETALHEFLHPLIRTILVRNPTLYNSLIIQMKRSVEGKAILEMVHKTYSELNVSDREEEALVQYLGKLADNKLKAAPEFLKLLQVFYQRILEILKEIFPTIHVENLNLNTKLNDIVDMMFSGNRIQVTDLPEFASKKVEEKTKENEKAAGETDSFLSGLEENANDFEEFEQPENDKEREERLAKEKRLGIIDSRDEDKIKYRYRDKKTGGIFNRITMELERFFSVSNRRSAEVRAKDIFLNQGKNINTEKVEYDGGKFFTFDELKLHFENKLGYYRRLGKIAHAVISREVARINGDKINMEKNESIIQDLSKAHSISEEDIDVNTKFKHLIGTYFRKGDRTPINKFEQLLKRLNIVLTGTSKFTDKIFSEVLIAINKVNLGGRIDFIVRHFDGAMSVYDFKSGVSMWTKNQYNTHFMNTLEDLNIENTEVNKAKLQLAFYVFMLKYNKPDAKFRNVSLVNISSYSAMEMHLETPVDLKLFLQAVERYFVNQPEQEEFYKEAKSKGLFQSDNYYADGKDHAEYQADSELTEEEMVISGQTELREAIKDKDSKKVMTATESLMARYNKLIGGAYDTTIKALKESKDFARGATIFLDKHNISGKPIIELWVQLVDKARELINKNNYAYMKERDRLLKKVKEEYLIKHPGQRIDLLNNIAGQGFKYKEFYSFVFVTNSNGVEEWVSPKDNKWNELTQSQKDYVTFLKKTAFEQFWMTMNPVKLSASYDEYIKTDMFKAETKEEQVRIQKVIDKAKLAPKIDKIPTWNNGYTWNNWYDGNTPRMGALNNEIFEKTDVKGGIINTVKMKIRRFNQPSGREITEVNGIEVKYLPENSSPMVTERTYSYDVTTTMDKFMENMLNKQYYDDLYYLNLGIQRIFKDTEQANHEGEFYMNSYNYIRDLMHIMILKTGHPDKPIKGVYPSRILRLASSLVSNSVMMLNPVLITSNFMWNNIMLHKEATKGSILNATGHKDSVLFDTGDIGRAWKEYWKMQKDLAQGRENKLYNFLKKYALHTDTYDYVVQEKHKLVGKNKGMDTGNLFMGQTVVERNTTSLIMAAMLMHQKNSVTGKSLYDSMDDNANWIGGKRGFNSKTNTDITDITFEELNTMRAASAKIMGGYRQDEKVALTLTWWGNTIMMFKRFIPEIMYTMFQGKYENRGFGFYQEKGTITENGVTYPLLEWCAYQNQGVFWTNWYFYKAMFVSTFFKSNPKDAAYQWNNLNDRQKANIVELLLSMGLYITGSIMYTYAWGDDSGDDDIWKQRCLYLTQDMIQALHPMNMIQTIKNPIVVASKMYDYLNAIGQLGEGVLTNDTIDRGVHKGEYKGWEGVKKGTPGLSIWYNVQKISNKDVTNK